MARAGAIARGHDKATMYDAVFAAVAAAYDTLPVTAIWRFVRAASYIWPQKRRF